MKQYRFFAASFAVLTVWICAPGAMAQEIARDAPWALRTHYSFPQLGMMLDYGAESSRLRLRHEDRVLADDMFFEIHLQEEGVRTFDDFDRAKTERAMFVDPDIGDATRYTTVYPTKDGLELRYHITVYRTRPFITAHMELTNRREESLLLKGLHPLVSGPDGIAGLGRQVSKTDCGGGAAEPYCDRDAETLVFQDPANDHIFALGMLPDGHAASGTRFRQHEGVWHGHVYSDFDPPLIVLPGATMSSDRVMLAHGKLEPEKVDLYYSWAAGKVDPTNHDWDEAKPKATEKTKAAEKPKAKPKRKTKAKAAADEDASGTEEPDTSGTEEPDMASAEEPDAASAEESDAATAQELDEPKRRGLLGLFRRR